MAIYQRTAEPFFTVSNVNPGATTNFRVTAYDANEKLLDSIDFQFASVALDAPETYGAGKSIDVAVSADTSLDYDLSWYYVAESGDVEITEAKGQTSFAPDAETYPIKIVATPIADVKGLCVCGPVETVVNPFNHQIEGSVSFANTGVADNQYSLSWEPIDGASTYSVKIYRDGAWVQYNKGLTETSCVLNGLYAAKAYEIRVCAMNENGRLTGEYYQTAFAPVRAVGSVDSFVSGSALSVSVLAYEDATYDIAWYYAPPDGDVEITEARGLLKYAPTNPQYDVKVVATGTGLSEGAVSEVLFAYSATQIETNYDAAAKTLQVVVSEIEGAVKYYIWKPAPQSGNMAIYQRTTEPVFTVSNVKPGATTDFRVTAYNDKNERIYSQEFKFASLALDASETYVAGKSIDVAVSSDASLDYDLTWYYVTESGDVEITEAKGQTSFTPDAETYPVKIVATPTADVEGLCVCGPVEAIVNTFSRQLDGSVSFANTGVADNQYSLSWEPIDGASTYSVKIYRDGAWVQYNKGLTETSCVMNGLYAGKAYEIRVCAMNENGRLTGEYYQTSFAPVRAVGSVNKFVAGDELGVSVQGSDDASCEIAWYYATPNGEVEITEARGLLTYVPENPQYDVKVVATGTGLSEGSVSEVLFVYSVSQTVETNYDAATKILQVVSSEIEGAAKYYLWKPAKSGNMAIYQRTTEPVFTVSNVKPGTTTNFRVTAYDAKGKILYSNDFQFASVALNAPETYEAGAAVDVAVTSAASLNYDLSWFYVTESGDVEITEAKGQTAFTPDAATYPIKIVATPVADVEGLCVCDPVEAVVVSNASTASNIGGDGSYTKTETASNAILDLDAELLDAAFIDLEDEMTLL